jgi:hypothetical protein
LHHRDIRGDAVLDRQVIRRSDHLEPGQQFAAATD